jgi:glycosyltransferase involved in cell wall biosynthesis
MSRTRRVVVLAPEPIRPRMAGMGIRALELARALRSDFDVLLVVPNAEDEARTVAGSLPVASAASGLAAVASGAAAAIVSGHAATAWFRQVPEVPVAADLYDPFPVENLHYAATLGPEPARNDREAFVLALARADFFLCASPEQRLFYSGALYAAGRIGAENFPADPSLARLLAVVPFGVPEEPAAGDHARGRAAAGVAAEGPLLLFGGVYDWYEPGLLLEAWPRVLGAAPEARLLFFENPNPETTPQRAFARARTGARKLDPSGRSIVFSPWLPYADRADLYAACDLLVSISAEGLESDLAFRTRLLDAAWGGVPSISIRGGTLARELEEAGAGQCVPGEPQALAEGILRMLASGNRFREAARSFAAGRNWKRVAEPLTQWCHTARVDPGRLPVPGGAPQSLWQRLGAGGR